MGFFKSIARFFTTLGGLLSSRVDEGTDSMVSTPSGIKAAYRETRERWKKHYQEVRDAVSQLIMVMEQKRSDIERLEAEAKDLEVRKRGAVERFKATKEEAYQKRFQDYHARAAEVAGMLEGLNGEVEGLRDQVDRYKKKLTEMQAQIGDLDKQEAEAIADIVSSRQIVELNDRMANLSTTLQDANLEAIQRTRAQLKARARLSEELAGTDVERLDEEIRAAGMSGDALDEFTQLLAESELKEKERPQGAAPEADRAM